MKKLLATAAVCGLVVAAAPAHAEIDLNLGGFFKGYGFYTDQDDGASTAAAAVESAEFDILRDTEIHFTGETTLDNGLTVGFHSEVDADNDEDFAVQESYAYFSSGWGRVNFGAEDGAAYLLQVAAPSADSNVDGIRQYVNPINYTALGGTDASIGTGVRGGLDYDQDVSGYSDKVTYLSPVFSGFQFGASYIPEIDDVSTEDAAAVDTTAADVDLDAAYELAVRYEGTFNNVGYAVGAGLSDADGSEAWNVGGDFDIGAFGVGVVYTQDEIQDGNDDDEETFVLGADYTTGPFKLGASYLNVDNFNGDSDEEVNRYTGGAAYTYGPGMTFRGSVSYADFERTGDDVDATSFLLGTQIDF